MRFSYTKEDVEKLENYLDILEWIRYDDQGMATNFNEIRVQIAQNYKLMEPYHFLRPIIPLMNEKGITLRFKEIIETMIPWLRQNQIIWFADYSKDPVLVAVYPTDQTEILKPGKSVIAVHWYTLILVMALFLPTELCDYIRNNAEAHSTFLASIFPAK